MALNVLASSAPKVVARRGASTTAKASRKVANAAVAPPVPTSLPGLNPPMEPFTNGIFDPFNFATGAPEKIVKRYREAELTHGRVAMLASVGFLVGEAVEGSSFLFDSQITGPAIGHFQQVPAPFWESLALCIGIAESYRAQVGWKNPSALGGTNFELRDEYTPGDIGYDPLGLRPTDPEKLEGMMNRELNNGRLAMVGILGMVIQEEVNGRGIVDTLVSKDFIPSF